jgi:hypothetical protein
MGAFQQWLFKVVEDPVLVDKTLFHEIQHHTLSHLEDLVPAVRGLKTAEDAFKLQEQLLGLLYQVEEIEYLATAKVRAGYDLDTRAEQFAAGRGSRQLRTIGDSLAWMVTNGDRRAIAALSQNDGPGRIYGKGPKGLEAEYETVNAFWRQGHFALLHDITNCLRIDDMTICNRIHREGVSDDHLCPEEDFGLHEVKANRRAKRSPEQLRRHEAAMAAINDSADIQTKTGPRKQFRWSGGYENHEDALVRVLDGAMVEGVAGEQIEDGWVITAVRFIDWKPGVSAAEIIGSWEARRAELLQKAGMTTTATHRIHTGDIAGRLLKCIPYALFSMEPRTAAFLTGDWLMFDSTLSIDYLETRLKGAGMEVTRLNPEGTVMQATVGNHSISVNKGSLEHVLGELVKIDVWAKAMAAWAAEPGFVGDGELILSLR